jgi:hypothetical protein
MSTNSGGVLNRLLEELSAVEVLALSRETGWSGLEF